MNTVLDADTLVRAALWLLALALPLAMLLWMAAQYVAMRSLGRRVRDLEAAAGRPARDGAMLEPDRQAPLEAPSVGPAPSASPIPAADGAGAVSEPRASDVDEGSTGAAS